MLNYVGKSESPLYLGTEWHESKQDRLKITSSVTKAFSELPIHHYENIHPYGSPTSFVSREKQTESLKSQNTLPKASSIGKRLEEFKQRSVP